MADHSYDRVANHPAFLEMITRRNRFAVILSLIVLAVYYGFVLIAVFRPGLFAAPVTEGLTWPLGLVGGFIIQGFAFVMTGLYVRRANCEFDALNRTLIEEAGR